MSDYGTGLYVWTGALVQFAAAFIGIASALRVALHRRGRWRMNWRGWRKHRTPDWLMKLGRTDRESRSLHERIVLLAGCGMRIDPRAYLACRRLLIAVCLLAVALSLGLDAAGMAEMSRWWKSVLAASIIAGVAYCDGTVLRAMRKYRTDRIRRELIAVSSQLLYYTSSRLHLHGKLMKCLPLTGMIRTEISLLLNEWYHDPDRALQDFKQRLGTDEAYGFAESIRSLRLHESDEVYDLMRELVREYKAKIDLAREGRKETASYLMFVLAGIPILYTFQIFLHPWVQEASRLFDALNA